MRVLVTGGAGYIGSHVVVALLEAGHAVTVVDDLSTGHPAAVARAERLGGRGVTFLQSQVATLSPSALAGHDAVIHFAASKRVDESMSHPERYFENNTGSMGVLLRAMAEAGTRRIVYSSSAAVYGTQAQVPVHEDAELRPESPYGVSKLQGEQMLDWMGRLAGWSTISLRYFNPVGAHPSGQIGQSLLGEVALVPRAMRALLFDDAPITVFGADWPTPDGSCQRDFIHVDDLARAHVVALGALDPPGHRVYNVGTGQPHSVLSVLRACAAAAGRPVPHTLGPRRAGDFPVSVADPSRFRDEHGFVATKSLREMIESAWRWARDNPRGYAP